MRYEQLSVGELTLGGDIRRVDPRRGTITTEGNELTQAWYEQSVAQLYPLGTRLEHPDGRVFRYASDGGSAAVAGNVLQSAVNGGTTTLQKDCTIATASAVGDRFGYATIKTDTIVANLFKDGYYIVSDGTAAQGAGQIYQIKSHAAAAAATCKFYFYEPCRVLISTSAKAGLMTNPYNAIIQAPVTTPTGVIVGVAPIAVTASYYFWVQTWGIANVLIKTALTAGTSVIRDTIAAGSAGVSSGSEAVEVIGMSGSVTDTTDNGFVFLTIAP